MRLNTNMMLLAGYIAVVSAVPQLDDRQDDLPPCGQKAVGYNPQCIKEQICLKSACSIRCQDNDGCTTWRDTACVDVYPKPGARSLGTYCIRKTDCESGYKSHNWYVEPESCKNHCAEGDRTCNPGLTDPGHQLPDHPDYPGHPRK